MQPPVAVGRDQPAEQNRLLPAGPGGLRGDAPVVPVGRGERRPVARVLVGQRGVRPVAVPDVRHLLKNTRRRSSPAAHDASRTLNADQSNQEFAKEIRTPTNCDKKSTELVESRATK